MTSVIFFLRNSENTLHQEYGIYHNSLYQKKKKINKHFALITSFLLTVLDSIN